MMVLHSCHKGMLALVLLLCFSPSPSVGKRSIDVKASELFVMPLHPSNFSVDFKDVQYSASLLGLPDLPSWLHLSPSSSSSNAFLHGVPPPNQDNVQVEVIARNMQTFDTSRRVYKLNILPQPQWRYSVLLKVTNLNLDELLTGDRHLELLDVVTRDLWQDKTEIQHHVAHALVKVPEIRGVRDVVAAASRHQNDLDRSSVFRRQRKREEGTLYDDEQKKNHGGVDASSVDRRDLDGGRRALTADRMVQRSSSLMKGGNLVRGSHIERMMEQEKEGANKDVVLTGLMAATRVGDRVPSRPDVKEGVYASFGSNSPFSASLERLESEVSILLNRSPCPRYFKKTSYERFFRSRDFAIDWCSFRMYEQNSSDWQTTDGGNHWQMSADGRSWQAERQQQQLSDLSADLLTRHHTLLPLPRREEVPSPSYTSAVVETILVPVAVMLLLVGLLTLAMCCNPGTEGQTATAFLDELIDGFPSKASLQQQIPTPASLQTRAQTMIKGGDYPSLRSRRSQQHYSLSQDDSNGGYEAEDNGYDTAGDLDISNGDEGAGGSEASSGAAGDSPAPSSRRHGSTPRRFEDYATLTRPAPPPYTRGASASRFDD